MKEELAGYRIKDANEKILSSEILLKAKQYKDAASRAYYAMFSAARAVLATKGHDSVTHSGVITLFNQHFVKKGILSKNMGRLLAEAKDIRERGDYGDYIIVSEDEARKHLERARNFIKEIEKVLQI